MFIMIFTSCKIDSDKQLLKVNIQSDTTLILKKVEGQGNVWGINMKIVGEFKDTVELIHTDGDNIVCWRKMIGGVDSIYHADWYSDSCVIRFKDIKEPIVELYIYYEFLD